MLYDIIIIGAGPAGINAGIYADRYRLKTLLITENFGGQIAFKAVDIENYLGFGKISGQELIKKFRDHLKNFEVEVMEGDSATDVFKEDNTFFVKTRSGKEFEGKAVIVASGASPRKLNIAGEREFIGKGVSYCATCDAAMFKDKAVAVIGGGNAGFEAALALSSWANKIYILEFSPTILADESNKEITVKTGKIEVITNVALKEIKGDKFVNSINYEDRVSKEIKVLSVEGVFIEIGHQPANVFVKELVDFNEKCEIKVDDNFMSRTLGLFAAGDVNNTKYKQIIVAASEGAQSALSAYEYIRKIKA